MNTVMPEGRAAPRCLRRLYCLALSLATGCSVLPAQLHLETHPQTTSRTARTTDGYEDYAGVIHIHTTYSHDADGTFEEAVRVANAQRLDYLIITEHNNLRPLQEGKQGWHGGTLVAVGMEISAKGGHYLALNVTKEIDREHLTTQQVIDAVNQQGGFGFIAHPYFKRRRWTDWSVTGYTGIEAYNVAHDTLDENRMRLILWTLASTPHAFYASLIDRPYDPLNTWDTLIKQRHERLVGIGSADAHEIHVAGLKFAPYEMMFQLIRTHVLVPGHPLTLEALYDALRKGHAYLAIELLAPARGFSFTAHRGQERLGIMGDEVTLTPDLTLTAVAPAVAEIVLFKDGAPAAGAHAPSLQFPVTSPGVYRIEVSSRGKPWIFSNPIYIRPASPTTTSGQPSVTGAAP